MEKTFSFSNLMIKQEWLENAGCLNAGLFSRKSLLERSREGLLSRAALALYGPSANKPSGAENTY